MQYNSIRQNYCAWLEGRFVVTKWYIDQSASTFASQLAYIGQLHGAAGGQTHPFSQSLTHLLARSLTHKLTPIRQLQAMLHMEYVASINNTSNSIFLHNLNPSGDHIWLMLTKTCFEKTPANLESKVTQSCYFHFSIFNTHVLTQNQCSHFLTALTYSTFTHQRHWCIRRTQWRKF